ncbi:hypothetical protein [uncultured Tateyamaria sp.]|uniref:hypothetical protein n=1 Tax=uncultured Tateyamaria sp. TaxID=455651 RepID=UPI002618FB95|nr:hypothetical protein [uncultured Tateyamaria sp.]
MCVVAFAGYLYIQNYWNERELDPVALQDGKLQYRVIHDGKDRKRGTADDVVWDVPLPATFEIWRAYADHRPHDEDFEFLHAGFDLGSIGIQSVGAESNVKLRFLPHRFEQGARPYKHRATSTFLSDFDYIENISCRLGEDLGNGSYAFREPTQDEIVEMRTVYGPDVDFMAGSCLTKSDKRTRIGFFRQDSNPAGWGYCYFETGRCSFDLWYPIERIVEVEFARNNLSLLPEMDEFISEIVSESSAGLNK